jgi:hypothetical protein
MSEHNNPYNKTIYGTPSDNKQPSQKLFSQEPEKPINTQSPHNESNITNKYNTYRLSPQYQKMKEELTQLRQMKKQQLSANTPIRVQSENEEIIPSSPPIHHSVTFEPIYSEQDITNYDYYSFPEIKQQFLNPNQFIVPPNLPTYRVGTNPINDIEHFTRLFALNLNAHGLNIDIAWYRLLPLCVSIETQDWIQRTQSPTNTWKQICFSLHKQYGNPNKRREALVKLYSCKHQPEESIMDFIQKFIKLMHQAQISPENKDMIDYLLQQLPVNIAIQLESGMQYGRIRRSIIELEALARTYPGVYTRQKNNTNNNTSNNNNNRNTSNNTNNNNNRNYNNNNNRNYNRNKTNLYCKTHGNGNHTSENCRYPRYNQTNNNNNKTMINDNNKDSSSIVCYYCHEPGHVSTYCPTKEDNVKSRRTWMRENDSKLSNNDLEEYEIPISINNFNTFALVDTGANMTFITQKLVDQLNIFTIPVEGNIELAIPGFSVPRIAITEPVKLQCGDNIIETQLEVIHQLNGPPVFLGSNIISKLDIPINGLPFKTDMTIISSNNHIDKISPLIELTNNSSADITEEMVSDAMSQIKNEIEDNEKISPLEICPLEMAVVRLDTPENKFTHKRQYQIAEKIKPAMQKVIDEWLEEEVITRIKEPTQFNTPIFPIPKKDHTGAKTLCRPCMDFRALNDLIISDKYPLPLIHDIFESLKGSKYFTSLDLKSAYHRFPVFPEHQHKTAFTWNNVQYKFLRAPFGLKNLPSQFQHVIHYIFKDCNFVQTFIDDAIIFSPTWELHIKHVKIAINILNKYKLILNIPKCHFFKTSLLLLGFRIDAYGHSIDPDHMNKSINWPIPTTGKQIQAFLGFVNYFREHIPMISKLTAPLDKLRSNIKITPIEWTTEQQDAFETLKKILFDAPSLSYPDFSLPFFIATDASNVGIGAVIYQIHPEKQNKQYISFQARSLSVSERNYSATKRELLAIVFALKKFHKYVWGTYFTLYTDHKALTYLHTQPNLSPMLIGWYELIFDYNFAVFHKPGIKNILPDALSRFFTEEGNESDPHSTITIRQVNITENAELNNKEKFRLLQKQHLIGHFGPDAIVKKLKEQNISWKNILEDATKITKACIQCLRYNIVRHGYHPLTPIIANQPFDHIAIDLAGPFTTTINKEHWLLIIIDIHSRFVLLRTLIDKSAASVADTLLKVFFDFGFPRIIQSDNGTEFVNHIIKKITQTARIDHRLITPYHPRANGAAERTVQTAKLLILKLIKGIKQDWSLYVPFTQYCINNKIKNRTKTAPFSIMFGRNSNPLEDYTNTEIAINNDSKIKKHALFMQKTLFPAIREATEYVTQIMKDRFDNKHKLVEFPENTYVMVVDKIKMSKTDPTNEGPFKIIRKTQGGSYELANLDGTILKRRYPPKDLISISNNDIFQEEVYEIDSILDHRYNNNKEIEYKVHWKGYSSEHDTWEPFANFNSMVPIDKYWNQQQIKQPTVVSAGRE